MNSLPLKKIAIAIGVIVIIIAGVFYFNQTAATKPAETFVNPAFGEHISTFTSGVISSASPIRVSLAQNMVDSTEAGKQTSVKLFDFTPSISGETRWLDQRTVEFIPDEKLQGGTVYAVRFYLSKLVSDLPDDLRTFEYSFQIIPQNFEVSIENVVPYVKTDLTRQRIDGILATADVSANADIEKSLTAVQAGKSLKVLWTHEGDGLVHRFTVENVARGENESSVELAVSGKSFGVEREEKKEVVVPSLSDFTLINAKVVQSPEQVVILQFSDPLKETQDLAGLVLINDVGDPQYDIQDNEIKVYPPVRQAGTRTVTVSSGIKNILDFRMRRDTAVELTFEELNPAVRFAGKGSIMPSSDGLVVPFEAVNLRSVDVQIIRIYESNVLQFFQNNNFEGNSELRRVGKPIAKKNISLENVVSDVGRWNRFSLDLTTMISAEPGAIYQVQIGFRKKDAALACISADDGPDQGSFAQESWEEPENEGSYWDSYEEYYYDEGYDWEQRDNPCHSSYYNGQRTIRRNIIASDLGILVKRGEDGKSVVFVNDIKTTTPIAGVSIELYDFQQQLISTASTDAGGKAVITSKQRPFALIAKSGNQRGYLKMFEGESLSLSNFNVGGEAVGKGLKGMLYGERGVWRPGDSLYLTFILEDKLKLLPAAHPVVFELQNPQGQITSRLVRSASENGFYNFATATDPEAPTGNWTGRVKVGGTEFTQPLRIETVKPNRLKINLDFGRDKITAQNNNVFGNLRVNWLHGAPGRNLKAEFEVILAKAETKFAQYPNYVFEDPAKEFYSETQQVFSGMTDNEGNAVVQTTLEAGPNAPGMLTAVFRGKVFEESGNFSIDRFTVPYYPYSTFTGIRTPEGDRARGMLLTDTTHQIDVVTVDAEGRPVSRDGVEMTFYKLRWKWWWDNSGEDAAYMSDSYATLISEETITTQNGKGRWRIKVKYPEWGRYLVRAYDPVSGHSAAKVIYIDWPGWAGRARGGNEGSTMLSFTTDKPKYNIGEKATVMIPGSGEGRALVSVENGSTVILTEWVETKKGDTPFSFEVTREMTPNIFVHVTLLQPHAQAVNDLPIRLYGVVPLAIENPETHLEPVLQMKDELEPGKEVVIRVSEKTNRKMTYTLAVVDEGLLDLTRFKTPDPWSRFYSHEALGVRTWDLYDNVIGSFGGSLGALLAIGGDEALKAKDDDAKANRFKPVVKFFGPFTTDGSPKEHRFIMPQYIGSVKTMLVAGYEGAYGHAEKATPVRKPLMVLATLPRVLGPGEVVRLPVTLFTMDKNISNVNVSVKASGPVTLRETSQSVAMAGDNSTVDFELTVENRLGIAKIEVTATSGAHTATDVIEIDIRNPNPPVTAVADAMIEAGKDWAYKVLPLGMPGTNTGTLEVSAMPPINLGQRMRYLLQYPYGCIEQTTSAVFPQLYVDLIRPVTDAERAMMQSNIRAGIERLRAFQQRDGGFSYWPGQEDADSWSTTYAGHFLLEAEAKGFFIPGDMLKKWKRYQRSKATAWRRNQEYRRDEISQAYRLYSLALASDADMAGMNRLREQENLPLTASWMLAAAYAKAGQPEAAKKLVANLSTVVKPYQEMAYSYGSDLRDKAIILETLVLLDEKTKGFEILRQISEALSNPNQWMSTQTTAWCLRSAGAFASRASRGPLEFTYALNGKETKAKTDLPVSQISLGADRAADVKISNTSSGVLFVQVIREGTPARGDEQQEEKNLGLYVTYTDSDGNAVDPLSLPQGTEFVATVTVHNPGLRGDYRNMALKQIFPSGWEINNLRLQDAGERLTGDVPTYQDIRDDRVYTYFDLAAGQRKTFKVLLTASYAGSYYLPGVSCEAMYDRSIYARKKGAEVSVTKPVTQ